MRKFAFLAAFVFLGAACTNSTEAPTAPETISVPVRIMPEHAGPPEGLGQPAGVPHNFDTHLTGDAERPTPNDSRAQGQAVFQLSADGSELQFRLNVANIIDVTQAHIHMGPVDGTGGIVAWLYPSEPPLELIPGRTQGTLGEGTITAASLMGALEGEPLSALVEAMEAGNTYVNVHTLAFPPGEIRGQIR